MFTIFGASGFIGSRLAAQLRAQGEEVLTPRRDEESWRDRPLGHVIYAIGVTSDFRRRPLDAVDAHVSNLIPLLRHGRFDSLVYLSSTRVYRGHGPAREEDPLPVMPAQPDQLYEISKLAGESACLAAGRAEVRVVRLSNVYGAGMSRENFLAEVIAEAVETGRILLRSSLDSCKDFVAIEDVVTALPRIAVAGRRSIYNVASGRNVTNGELTRIIAGVTGCKVDVAAGAPRLAYPQIAIDRLRDELCWAPSALADHLPQLIAALRQRMAAA